MNLSNHLHMPYVDISKFQLREAKGLERVCPLMSKIPASLEIYSYRIDIPCIVSGSTLALLDMISNEGMRLSLVKDILGQGYLALSEPSQVEAYLRLCTMLAGSVDPLTIAGTYAKKSAQLSLFMHLPFL